jgi:hypothetical protein
VKSEPSLLHPLDGVLLRSSATPARLGCGAQEFDLASRKIGSGQSVYEHGVRAYIWKKDTVWIELQRDPLYCQLYESAILDFVLRRSALLPPICPTDSLRQNDDDM